MKPVKPELLKAIAVTAELLGTEMSPAAAEVFAHDVARYPLPQVLAALTRCRREVKGRLTIADVISRIDDGRPGPEEAWSLIPQDESRSSVWTEEMQRAYGVACPLLAEGDTVGARMAFKETYQREVQRARDSGNPVKWTATLGHDKGGRDEAHHEARNRNLLAQGLPALPYKAPEHAENYLPESPVLQLVGPSNAGEIAARVLAGAAARNPEGRRLLDELKAKLKGDAA